MHLVISLSLQVLQELSYFFVTDFTDFLTVVNALISLETKTT